MQCKRAIMGICSQRKFENLKEQKSLKKETNEIGKCFVQGLT